MLRFRRDAKLLLMRGTALVPAMSLDFSVPVLDPSITYTGASLRTVVDPTTGHITYAANNLLLTSASLGTQSITTTASNYILSFSGTGTVTLTGTSTAGPLVGTGVNNRVYLAFTPTAGTLTLTVSGSVTSAQVENVTFETTPRAYNATSASAYYGPRLGLDPAGNPGVGIFEQRTKRALWNNDLTNVVWTKSSVTAAKTATGPDGVANSASTITATAGNGTVLQSITSVSAERAMDAYVIRRTGSGTINMTMDGGTTWNVITVTGAWARVPIPVQTVTNPSVGFRIVTNTDAIDVAYVNVENDSTSFPGPTPPIATAASAVTVTADVLSMTGANFSSWYNPAQGTFVMQATPGGNYDTSAYLFSAQVSASDSINIIRYNASVNGPGKRYTGYVVSGSSVVASITSGSDDGGLTSKTALGYAANDFGLAKDGSLVGTDASGAVPSTATILYMGSNQGVGQWFNGHIGYINYYAQRLPNTTLQGLTT